MEFIGNKSMRDYLKLKAGRSIPEEEAKLKFR